MVQLLKSRLTTKNIGITINNPKIYTEAQKGQTARAILSRKISVEADTTHACDPSISRLRQASLNNIANTRRTRIIERPCLKK